jgi:CDGSH-type Zn-finger protein
VIRLRVRPRGPLTVELGEGDGLELIGADGQLIELEGRRKLTLCRCGASASRPFCDGAHNRIGFEAPPPVDAAEPAS